MTAIRTLVFGALAVALGALALVAGAQARSDARSATAASANLRFSYQQLPPGSVAQVTFDSGVQGIVTQTAAATSSTGTIRVFVASQRGFAITSAEGGSLTATVDEQVDVAAGSSAITGKASLPAGATLTVQVNNGAAIPITGAFDIQLSTLGRPGPHSSHSHPRRTRRRPHGTVAPTRQSLRFGDA